MPIRSARRLPVRAVGRVSLPDLPPPRAVLRVAFRRGDTVEYAVEWDYRGFGRVPFTPGPEAVRDPEAEAGVTERIRNVWQEHGVAFAPAGHSTTWRPRSS